MASPGSDALRACIRMALLAAIGLAPACEKSSKDELLEKRKGRKEPVCAVQDCATGEIIDDGCDQTGRCLSCVNSCAPPVAPSTAPAEQ